MRLIDVDVFEVVFFEGKSEEFVEGATYVLEQIDKQPTVEAKPVVHGEWIMEVEESANYHWGVIAECSNCGNRTKEIWGGYFPNFPHYLATDIAIESASNVEIDNFCPNCGCDMRKKVE